MSRGATRAGTPAPIAPEDYQAPADRIDRDGVILFHGEDRRRHVLDLTRNPMPAWHPILAPAIAAWIGPGGGRRTFASAQRTWNIAQRFLVASQERCK